MNKKQKTYFGAVIAESIDNSCQWLTVSPTFLQHPEVGGTYTSFIAAYRELMGVSTLAVADGGNLYSELLCSRRVKTVFVFDVQHQRIGVCDGDGGGITYEPETVDKYLTDFISRHGEKPLYEFLDPQLRNFGICIDPDAPFAPGHYTVRSTDDFTVN